MSELDLSEIYGSFEGKQVRQGYARNELPYGSRVIGRIVSCEHVKTPETGKLMFKITIDVLKVLTGDVEAGAQASIKIWRRQDVWGPEKFNGQVKSFIGSLLGRDPSEVTMAHIGQVSGNEQKLAGLVAEMSVTRGQSKTETTLPDGTKSRASFPVYSWGKALTMDEIRALLTQEEIDRAGLA